MNNQSQNVLIANAEFYEALVNGDFNSMESLWATSDDVAVIHPGWPPLHGREAVMDSWRRILAGDSTREIFCRNARCYLMNETAFVVCSECFPEGELVATNIFIREDGMWRIVHHQGGPLQMITEENSGETLH